jgi:hypothetical protein
MPASPPATPNATVSGPSHSRAMAMLTVTLTLDNAQQLGVALPTAEWERLVADFAAMPAPERSALTASLRASATHNPFPTDGEGLTAQQQATCDTFVNDCLLLAALAEAVGERALLETAISTYVVQRGPLPRGALHA